MGMKVGILDMKRLKYNIFDTKKWKGKYSKCCVETCKNINAVQCHIEKLYQETCHLGVPDTKKFYVLGQSPLLSE